jgi:hypothetical protein
MDENRIRIGDALRIKSAEFWLKLGQPLQASLELQKLTNGARGHPWASKVFHSAYRAARRI